MSRHHEATLDHREVEFLLNSEGQPVKPSIVEHTRSVGERLSDLSDLPEEEQVERDSEQPIVLAAGNTNPLDEPSLTFPFNRDIKDYTYATRFVKKLYEGRTCWLSNTEARESFTDEWMNRRIGNQNLTPVTGEPVGHTQNPSWRWAESWRAINVWETLRTLKEDKPLAAYLDLLDGTQRDAMWPAALRNLLRANEDEIYYSRKNWIGREKQSKYYPFPGVKVVNAGESGIKYYQTGAIGPMCVEAAFILATQLAGINWRTLRTRTKGKDIDTGIYWDSAILPDGNGDETILETRNDRPIPRTLGYLSRPNTGAPSGSPDAGFYLAFDIDPDMDGATHPDKNVFIFASHVIDIHSRLHVQNEQQLHQLKYSAPYEPGTKIPPVGPKDGANVYFYGHAHAAILPYKQWMEWIGQETRPGKRGEKMPNYSQIGETHIYFLTENEDAYNWPRAEWLAAHPN